MNIIITLPQELIAEILNGHKTIELRKNFPIHYRENLDWVYVVTKGKATVQLAFQISGYIKSNMFGHIWQFKGKRLCIPFDWYAKYTQNARYVVLWQIVKIAYAKKPIPLSDIKHNAKAPQSFVYCDTPFEELPFTIMTNLKTRKKAVQ